MERLNLPEESFRSKVDLSREIFEARKIIRTWGYLETAHNRLLCLSLGNPKLINLQFLDFLNHSNENKMMYYKSFLIDKAVTLSPITPFISGTDFKEITFTDLVKKVRKKVKTLPYQIQNYYLKQLKKHKTTEGLIEFDLLIEEELRDMEARQFDRGDFFERY